MTDEASPIYYKGGQWIITTTIRDPVSGDLAEPGSVKVKVYPPALEVGEEPSPVELTASRDSEGTYTFPAVNVTRAGPWLAVLSTTAPLIGVLPQRIYARDPSIKSDLIGVPA